MKHGNLNILLRCVYCTGLREFQNHLMAISFHLCLIVPSLQTWEAGVSDSVKIQNILFVGLSVNLVTCHPLRIVKSNLFHVILLIILIFVNVFSIPTTYMHFTLSLHSVMAKAVETLLHERQKHICLVHHAVWDRHWVSVNPTLGMKQLSMTTQWDSDVTTNRPNYAIYLSIGFIQGLWVYRYTRPRINDTQILWMDTCTNAFDIDV